MHKVGDVVRNKHVALNIFYYLYSIVIEKSKTDYTLTHYYDTCSTDNQWSLEAAEDIYKLYSEAFSE